MAMTAPAGGSRWWRGLSCAAIVLTATVLVGHSYGGAAAIAAADRLPSVTHIATLGAPFDVAHVIESIGVSREAIARDGRADFTLFGRPLVIGADFVEQASNDAQRQSLAHLAQSLLGITDPDLEERQP